MTISRSTRIVLRVLTAVILAFIYVPLLLVLVNSFNVNKTFAWPPRDFTLDPGGKWMLVANQGSNELLVMRIKDDGSLALHGRTPVQNRPTFVGLLPR